VPGIWRKLYSEGLHVGVSFKILGSALQASLTNPQPPCWWPWVQSGESTECGLRGE
jgi:hypothetical protein